MGRVILGVVCREGLGCVCAIEQPLRILQAESNMMRRQELVVGHEPPPERIIVLAISFARQFIKNDSYLAPVEMSYEKKENRDGYS